MRVGTKNLFEENDYEIAQRFGKRGIFPDTVKSRICLKDMQMRIHCLAFVGILVGQPHIGNGAPVAGKRFEIAILFVVAAMAFYIGVKTFGIVKSLLIPVSAIQFRKAIDDKGYGIYLLLVILRFKFRGKRPICTTIFLIVEMIDNQRLCTIRHFKEGRIARHPRSRGEGP